MSKIALFFLLALVAGVIATFAYTPVAAFLTYQMVYFFNPDNRWWGASIPGLRYSLFIALVMIVVFISKYRQLSELSPWSRQPILRWLLAILVMYYIMYFFAINPLFHDKFTFEFTKLIVIIWIAYKLINSEWALKASMWAYILGATYVGKLARDVGRNSSARVEGIGMADAPDANDTAAILVPPLVFLLYFAWLGNWKVRALTAVCAAFIVNGLVLINSRGAFLGAIVGCGFFLIYMIFSRFQRKWQRPMAVLIIATGLSGAFYLADDTFFARMETLKVQEDGSRGGDDRVDYWFKTFDMMRDYPMGLGIFGYQTVSPAYLDQSQLASNSGNRAVHSTWFQILSELGWFGWLLFAGLFWRLWRLTQQTKFYVLQRGQTNQYFLILALEGALFSFLVAATFIDRARAEVMYWLILYLAVASNIFYLRLNSPVQKGSSTAVAQNRSGLTKDQI
ncbi:O-antigen polymerase [Alishewanella agri BL06]|uniref:O-antigen polymerase n=1 Tax=Alishewanella agri BL06 TaxID=1195246 RepID=I9P5Q8_9ALTE|nr:O-antigen ligase family protein [Alishewanella agri]EIW90352.1 O-antigen polymerase [Alishewanella agri BL06]